MNYRLIVVAALLSGSAVHAAERPSAGSQLQQIPAATVPDAPAPQLRIESDEAPRAASANGARITVRSLHVVGAHAFGEAELIAATGFEPGGEMSLSDLRGFAARITRVYHDGGFFLAQAHLPPQDIIDGAVTIAVVEGRYGKVVLHNESKLADAVARRLLDGLNDGDAITLAPLESRLLQLSDLPGVQVKSTLAPGATAGTSDLLVDVTPGRRLSGNVEAGNSGSRYTGEYRLGGTLNVNNPLGRADVATLRVLTSWEGLDYGRAAWQMQLGRADVGLAFTALDYDLGREFESLNAHGTARIASLYGQYPLLRSRRSNLYAQLDLESKDLRDTLAITTPATVDDKRAKVAALSLTGDLRDRRGGGGLTSYTLTWTSGSLDIESAQALSLDTATARTQGQYDKLSLSVMRLQRVTESLSLYASGQGQLSSHNLDVSEKMGLAGVSAVRAYPEGEAYVDEGFVLSLEARLLLPRFTERLPGRMQLVGFFDSATGRLNDTPWDADDNHRTLSGAGLGLSWFEASDFVVKAQYAFKIGSEPTTSAPDADGRFWLQTVKYF